MLLAAAFAALLPATAHGADELGVYGGIDGGYSTPRGHEYGGNLEDGLDALHGYVGYRIGGMLSLEASALDIQAPIKGSKSTADIRTYSVDARVFVPMGSVQPNFLIGYAPVADLHIASGSFSEDLHGHSWNLGAGARFVVVPKLYLTLDVRHMFIRHTRGEASIGGATVSGTFDHEQRGDITALLVGGGLQF